MGGLENDPFDALVRMVNRFIGQAQDADYRDKHGHPLENNVHYEHLRQACFTPPDKALEDVPPVCGDTSKASEDQTNGEPA